MPSGRSLKQVVIGTLAFLLAQSLGYCATPLDTKTLFQKVSRAIVQVKISNIHSSEKSSIGSGFFVRDDGYLITNYHVISSVVREPDDYQVQLILSDGEIQQATIIDIDLVHDLALLKSEEGAPISLAFHHGSVEKGTELASIGNPHDLGMTVVKGSYSGTLSDYLYERIHFTGAINPGMSGGPALDIDNQVIGINVATAGNEVGFLVPAKYAEALLKRVNMEEGERNIEAEMGQQLLVNQKRFSKAIFDSDFPLTELGDYQVPDRWGGFMRCWGDSQSDENKPYKIVTKQCSSEDDIYIDSNYSTGTISMEHNLISSEVLSPYRFSRLYEVYFSDTPSTGGSKEDVTNFECHSDFVHTGRLKMKLAFCLRRHHKFDGLYDLLLKGATMERSTSGLQTTLHIEGISQKNALAVARRYVSAFRWKQ